MLIPNFARLRSRQAKFARRAAAKNPEGVLSRLAGYPKFCSPAKQAGKIRVNQDFV